MGLLTITHHSLDTPAVTCATLCGDIVCSWYIRVSRWLEHWGPTSGPQL